MIDTNITQAGFGIDAPPSAADVLKMAQNKKYARAAAPLYSLAEQLAGIESKTKNAIADNSVPATMAATDATYKQGLLANQNRTLTMAEAEAKKANTPDSAITSLLGKYFGGIGGEKTANDRPWYENYQF